METRWRVAIIEDDENIAHILATYLSQSGYEVATHESREDALVALTSSTIDLLIMDYTVPGMGPEDFVGIFRKNFSHVPIILISGDPDIFEHASRLSISYAIRKPLDFRLLRIRINQVLEGRVRAFAESVRA